MKLFYSQRLGRFAEVEPSPKMILFAFPFAIFLIAGPLYSLVLFLSYVKYSILIIPINMLTSLFVTNCILTRKVFFEHEEILYKQKKNEPISNECKEIAARQRKGILITTTVTS